MRGGKVWKERLNGSRKYQPSVLDFSASGGSMHLVRWIVARNAGRDEARSEQLGDTYKNSGAGGNEIGASPQSFVGES